MKKIKKYFFRKVSALKNLSWFCAGSALMAGTIFLFIIFIVLSFLFDFIATMLDEPSSARENRAGRVSPPVVE